MTTIPLHEQIRALRQQAGLTQKQLGEKCGLVQEAISRFEHGHTPDFKLKTLYKLVRGLGKEIKIT